MKKTNEPTIQVTAENGSVKFTAPNGCTAKFIGADFPQLVDNDLNIHTPLCDCEAVLSFRIEKDGKAFEQDVRLALKGEYGAKEKKPAVLPEPAQWHAESGAFRRVNAVACKSEALLDAAEDFAAQLSLVLAREIPVGADGEIVFEQSSALAYLGEEGYQITCRENELLIGAAAYTGAVWAGKTVCQLMRAGSFPCGVMRDYPRYPVRGFMLDVGRRPVSLATLDKIADAMAWYKMNDFQVHLSDNYIWLEEYADRGDESTFDAYSAFRLESGVKNKKGETAASADYHYTKDEFRAFISRCKRKGVRIVPEIDMPAHALAFTRVFPEHAVLGETSSIMKTRPLTDHLNVKNSETVEFIKSIFDDYTGGENPVFSAETPVHIGADEFLSDYGAYRRFINEFVPYLKKTNPVRLWGGLTWIKDEPETKIIPEAVQNVQMNLWASSWADGREMYDMGYELINTIDHHLYMVPNGSKKRASYGDYLNKKKLFAEFEPSRVRLKDSKYTALPAGSKQVLGAAYAIWNDNIDKKANGLCELDLFCRFLDSAAVMAEKTWGSCTEKATAKQVDAAAEKIGGVPQKGAASLSPIHETELHGGCDFVSTGANSLPVGARLKISAVFNETKAGQILLEGDCAYGTYDVRFVKDGRLGFTCDGHEFKFDFDVPAGKRIDFVIETKPLRTVLRLGRFKKAAASGSFTFNGKLRASGIKNSTFSIPVQRLGSETNAVKAKIFSIEQV